MALNNKRISVVADTIVNDVKIASFGAVLNAETNELSMTTRYIDKEACKEHRDEVRQDYAKFEDFAYAIQDAAKKLMVTE